MRLTRLEVAGFRGFASPQDFALDYDAVVVVGANGFGKTSLFDAILWGLLGTVPRLGGEDARLLSLYSPTGGFRVSLSLRDNGDEIVIVRTFDGTETHVSVDDGSSTRKDRDAAQYLVHRLCPAAGEDASTEGLTRLLTRSVYLEQDRVRQFIEADDEHERFVVVSELVGSGQITDLQKRLDQQRRAWSRSTNDLRGTLNARNERRNGIASQLNQLGESMSDLSAPEDLWRSWWQRAQTLGLADHEPVDLSSPDSPNALDAAVREILVLRQQRQRLLDRVTDVAASIERLPSVPTDELNALRRLRNDHEQQLDGARSRLAAAQKSATAAMRARLELEGVAERAQALAALALEQLGERCPVCDQPYDESRTRTRLESLMAEAAPKVDLVRDADEAQLRAIADVESAEGVLRVTDGRMTDLTRTQEAATHASAELSRRLSELGINLPADRAGPALREQEAQLQLEIDGLAALEADGERLALGLVRAREAARRIELERQLRATSAEASALEAEVDKRDRTSEIAQTMLDALQTAERATVKRELARINPVLQRIWDTVDPHLALRTVDLIDEFSYGRGRIRTRLQDDARGEEAADPVPYLSSSQLNALAVTIFLAFNLSFSGLPIRAALLDDPLQSLDDVNLLGLVDLLRRARGRRQLIVSTHDKRFGQLLARKLRPVNLDQRTTLIAFSGWDREGPSVEQSDVPASSPGLRIAS